MELFRKTASLLLLTIYLFSATNAKELIKLPLLVEHFYDHRAENKYIGLITFFIMHYSSEDGTDKDAKEDNQLPFKSAELATVSVVSVTPPSFIKLFTPEIEIKTSFNIGNDLLLPSQYLNKIWQPPRDC